MTEYIDFNISQYDNTICSDGNEGKWGNANRNMI